MLHSRREAQGYPLHRLDVVHERPKPKYPLRDLVKLWQEAKQKEQEADRRAEHWHRAYDCLFSLKGQGSMLILSTGQRRDRGRRDCRFVSRVLDRPRNPKQPGKGPPRPQILARVLRNPIERTTREEKIKKTHTLVGIICFPVYYYKETTFSFLLLFFWSTNDQAAVPEPTPGRLECAIEKLNRYKH